MDNSKKGDGMRNKKKYAKSLFLAAVAAIAVMGCSSQNKGAEASKDTPSAAEKETQAVLEKVTYTSSDGGVSIILPDSNWKNTTDADGKLVFVSDGEGEITIDHAESKKELAAFGIGSTEEKLEKRLQKLGENVDDLEISDFLFDKSDGIRKCSYVLKHRNPSDGTYYTAVSISALEKRGYQITANIKADDTVLLASVRESMNSFLVLKNPLSAEAVTDADSDGNRTDESADASSDEKRYFFDEPGNTIYVTQNSDGAWVDQNGMAYKFYEYSVEDSNGTKYYYDPPAYRSGSSADASDSDSSSGSDYYDFYDKNGNYIRAEQDENGNWVGDDGRIYIFGEKGVTDSDGNFHPY